jgi:hypothetical protein
MTFDPVIGDRHAAFQIFDGSDDVVFGLTPVSRTVFWCFERIEYTYSSSSRISLSLLVRKEGLGSRVICKAHRAGL